MTENKVEFYTSKQVKQKIGLGIAEFKGDVFHIKCYSCFELMPATTDCFYKTSKALSNYCKYCVKISDINKQTTRELDK